MHRCPLGLLRDSQRGLLGRTGLVWTLCGEWPCPFQAVDMERAWVPREGPFTSLCLLGMYRQLSRVESLPESPVWVLVFDLWVLWKS